MPIRIVLAFFQASSTPQKICKNTGKKVKKYNKTQPKTFLRPNHCHSHKTAHKNLCLHLFKHQAYTKRYGKALVKKKEIYLNTTQKILKTKPLPFPQKCP